jgi:hypothetical protein
MHVFKIRISIKFSSRIFDIQAIVSLTMLMKIFKNVNKTTFSGRRFKSKGEKYFPERDEKRKRTYSFNITAKTNQSNRSDTGIESSSINLPLIIN